MRSSATDEGSEQMTTPAFVPDLAAAVHRFPASSTEIPTPLLEHVVADHPIAATQEVGRHRRSHDSEPDDANVRLTHSSTYF